jgi:uncharacterized membrane protein
MTISRETIPKKLVITLLIFSFLGFLDATYLSAEHFAGSVPYCSFLTGCELVTTGEYSMIGPIPVAYMGLAYYALIFILVMAYRECGVRKILKYLGYLTFLGFLFSLWMVYLQAFIIEAFCLYCVISATTSTILFILALATLIESKWLEYLAE